MSDLDSDSVDAIAPYVIEKLTSVGFFEKLDDRLCPSHAEISPQQCRGKYEISEPLLHSLGFDNEERSDIFQVLQSKGGFCDCEIL